MRFQYFPRVMVSGIREKSIMLSLYHRVSNKKKLYVIILVVFHCRTRQSYLDYSISQWLSCIFGLGVSSLIPRNCLCFLLLYILNVMPLHQYLKYVCLVLKGTHENSLITSSEQFNEIVLSLQLHPSLF